MREREADLRLVEASPLRYLVLPPGSRTTPAKAWPVLCFLHGSEEAAPVDIREALTRHGPLRPYPNWRVLDPFIIVAPQLPRAGDTWHRYADAVHQLVLQVHSEYHGDPQHTYLTGFSFGANGVFDLALAQPGFWAALWAVDPTRVPSADPQRPVWLSIGAAARPNSERFIKSLGLEPGGAAGRGDRIYLDEGQDHVGSATLAYRDDRIYDWLLTKHLPV